MKQHERGWPLATVNDGGEPGPCRARAQGHGKPDNDQYAAVQAYGVAPSKSQAIVTSRFR
jgi:hypothetical protein